MTTYKWAANKLKLERAIKTSGPKATEETIKERYKIYGGLVLGEEIEEIEKVVKDKNLYKSKPEDGIFYEIEENRIPKRKITKKSTTDTD